MGSLSNLYEPVREKTNNLCFRPGSTNIRLCSHRRLLETANFGFRKKRNCTIRVAKTKTLISFAVTAKLICAFVFAYADCWFSHAAAHIFLATAVAMRTIVLADHLGIDQLTRAFGMVALFQGAAFMTNAPLAGKMLFQQPHLNITKTCPCNI